MGSGFAVISNAADWEVYRQSTEQSLQLSPQDHKDWGKGPQDYPCLVATGYEHECGKFRNCFVYLPDAMRLLSLAPEMLRELIKIGQPESEARIINTVGPSQAAFNTHIAALLAAIITEMVDVKVTNRERFETVFQNCLAKVDQYKAGQDDAIEPLIRDALGLLDADAEACGPDVE